MTSAVLNETAGPASDRQVRDKREAAARLGVSVRTLERAIAAKLIAVTRVGRRVLVPVAEIEKVERNGLPSFPASRR